MSANKHSGFIPKRHFTKQLKSMLSLILSLFLCISMLSVFPPITIGDVSPDQSTVIAPTGSVAAVLDNTVSTEEGQQFTLILVNYGPSWGDDPIYIASNRPQEDNIFYKNGSSWYPIPVYTGDGLTSVDDVVYRVDVRLLTQGGMTAPITNSERELVIKVISEAAGISRIAFGFEREGSPVGSGAKNTSDYAQTRDGADASLILNSIRYPVEFSGISLPQQTITFPSLSIIDGILYKTYGVLVAYSCEAYRSVGTGAVSYSSSDTTVATVNNIGMVEIHQPGITVITATAAEVPGIWAEASVSYTLVVLADTPGGVDDGEVWLFVDGDNEGILANGFDAYTLTATVINIKEGIPVSNVAVAFSIVSGDGATLNAATGITNAAGRAQAKVYSNQPGTVVIRASVAGIPPAPDPGDGKLPIDTASVVFATEINIQCSITYNANEGIGEMEDGAVEQGGDYTIQVNAFTRDGYTFKGWNTDAEGNGTSYAADETILDVQGDITLFAQWTAVVNPPVLFTITFNANSGTVSPATRQTGADGKLAALPTPTRSSYTFNGWYTAATGGIQITTNTIFTSNATIFAQWAYAGGGGGGGSYTSSAPTTISAPAVPLAPLSPFTDVAADAWYANAVLHVFTSKLMLGTTDTLFSPNTPVTRAMAATILYRLAGSPELGEYDNAFTDVVEGAWYAQTVNWAASVGLVAGYGGGLFGSEDSVTVEQLTALLYRVQQFTGKPLPALTSYKPLADIDATSVWASTVLKALATQGMFDGLPGDRLNPGAVATRAQIASILSQYLTAAEKLAAAK